MKVGGEEGGGGRKDTSNYIVEGMDKTADERNVTKFITRFLKRVAKQP